MELGPLLGRAKNKVCKSWGERPGRMGGKRRTAGIGRAVTFALGLSNASLQDNPGR